MNNTHSWDEVHGQRPGEIVRDLRTILPPGFRAAPNVHLGSAFEIDVSTHESVTAPDADEGGTATQTALSPTLTVEADLSEQDEYEVRIHDAEHGRVIVAAIEIVSPSTKDRPGTRDVFVGKLATLLRQGICVSVVDLVSLETCHVPGIAWGGLGSDGWFVRRMHEFLRAALVVVRRSHSRPVISPTATAKSMAATIRWMPRRVIFFR